MSIVHFKSGGRDIARGMSWPFGTSVFESALRARSEPEIWLSVWRDDCAKSWAGVSVHERPEVTLATIEYRAIYVVHQVDAIKRAGSSNPPAWYGLDDPPLVSARLSSVPSALLKVTGLTRRRAATAFTQGVNDFAPRRIAEHDWSLHLSLRPAEFCLHLRLFHAPVRDWDLVRELKLDITEQDASAS